MWNSKLGRSNVMCNYPRVYSNISPLLGALWSLKFVYKNITLLLCTLPNSLCALSAVLLKTCLLPPLLPHYTTLHSQTSWERKWWIYTRRVCTFEKLVFLPPQYLERESLHPDAISWKNDQDFGLFLCSWRIKKNPDGI